MRASALARDRFQLGDLDRAREPVGLALVEAARTHLQRRCRPGRDRLAKRVLRRFALEMSREEGGQQDVARTNGRNRLDARRADAVAMSRPLLPKQREATRLLRDQNVPHAALGDRLEADDEILVLVELLADKALCLVLVRRDRKST